MRVIIIRTDGREETVNVPYTKVAEMIGAKVCTLINIWRHEPTKDRFKMRSPIMMVDDEGYEVVQHVRQEADVLHISNEPTHARKPMNAKATELYHSICKPGTTHAIVGDVAIIDDEES